MRGMNATTGNIGFEMTIDNTKSKLNTMLFEMIQ